MLKLWGLISKLVLIGLVLGSSQDTDVEASPVPPDLSVDDFHSLKGTYFVKFYSPTCGACKAFAPKWDAAYRDVGASESKGFKWANVNCQKWGDLCNEQGIAYYPSLKVYRDSDKIYDVETGGLEQSDLRYFATKYIEIGDKAFSKEYETAPAEDQTLAVEQKQEQKSDAEQKDSSEVAKLSSEDFGADKNPGRWFVLFAGADCSDCDTLLTRWADHKIFAGEYDKIKWGIVDCQSDRSLCEREQIIKFPTVRVYENGVNVYDYNEGYEPQDLRVFVKHASSAFGFKTFDLNEIIKQEAIENTANNPAGPPKEPNYLQGDTAPAPNYLGKKPSVDDVVKYTLSTLGNPIDTDPGKLIFGDNPEYNHNFRNWGAPDAAPPPLFEDGKASYAHGDVKELGSDFQDVVKNSMEPWLMKFYSPRCPHCQEMKPAYDAVAAQLKDKLNVGAVNCDIHPRVCRVEDVTEFPFVVLYKGTYKLAKHTGRKTSESIYNYAQKAWTSQIHEINDEVNLLKEIADNMNMNYTTYLYLYDNSVTVEDWESLKRIAAKLDEYGGKVYRTNDNTLRELAGIKHRGAAFVNVDNIGDSTSGILKWYDFPYSNIPKNIRNVSQVSNWAYRTKYSLVQYLDAPSQSKFSPFIAVLLTDGRTNPGEDPKVIEHKKIAHDFRDYYHQRQIEDHDRIRIDKLKQYDAALIKGEFALAKQLMQQPVESHLISDLAFAYIPENVWTAEFGKYLDTRHHLAGEIIIVDFYHGRYLDRFNEIPINPTKAVLNASVELLHRYLNNAPKTNFKGIKFFRKSMPNIPKAESRTLHFDAHIQNSRWGSFTNFVEWIFVISVCYYLYRKYGRAALRRLVVQLNSNSNGNADSRNPPVESSIFYKND